MDLGLEGREKCRILGTDPRIPNSWRRVRGQGQAWNLYYPESTSNPTATPRVEAVAPSGVRRSDPAPIGNGGIGRFEGG